MKRINHNFNRLHKRARIAEAWEKFLEAFEERFNVNLYEDKLTDKELSLMNKFAKEKYGKEEWTFSREPEYEEVYTKKVESGLIFIKGVFKKNFIDEIKTQEFFSKNGEIVKLQKSVRDKFGEAKTYLILFTSGFQVRFN